MHISIGANSSLDKFSLEINNMDARQLDCVRILLKTIVDYGPVFEEADTSGLELKSLIGLASKTK